jgi:ribosome modulation factor
MPNTIELKRAYEFGEQAAMLGKPVDDCPYRLHDLKAAWLRGYHGWQRANFDQPIEATAEGRVFLTGLKAMLKGLQ